MNTGIVTLLGVVAVVLLVAGLAVPSTRRFVWPALVAVGVFFLRCWWWLKFRLTFAGVCREGGLSKRRTKRVVRRGVGEESIEKWSDPRLLRVKTSPYGVTLKVRTRKGQRLEQLEDFGSNLAASYSADSIRTFPAKRRPGSTVMFELIMRDLIKTPATAQMPAPTLEKIGHVDLGRRQSGKRWNLQIIDRQTLVVGASGAGKGSVLWGVVCSLAPGISLDAVRMWGGDLKGGLELGMAESLFHRTAYTGPDAVAMVDELLEVAEARTEEMRGESRSFKPGPGKPLHVLVIDELASLTAYSDKDTQKSIDPKLKRLLSIGRAVGVVVIAFIQDPRKEVVDARGLFTQVIALRLRSKGEVVMVLDETVADKARAHRISITAQGTGYIIDEDGSIDRVRADYWPDSILKQVAKLYPAGSGWRNLSAVAGDTSSETPTLVLEAGEIDGAA